MRLLHVIGTVDPAYGGPVEALRQVTLASAELGHRAETVTLDEPTSPAVDGFPSLVHAFGPSRGKYRYNARLVPWLSEHARDYDAVVAHGIWQYQSFAVWQVARKVRFPYFIFVHGALDPWFKRQFPLKHVKKWLYWPWAEYRVLRDASAVLFTCEEERSLARQSFWLYQANEAIVPIGIRVPDGNAQVERDAFLAAYPRSRGKRLLLFMSRIHQKKGLDLLIEAFARMAGRDPRLHLVVAGPDQAGLQAGLNALAQRRGVAERITWTGMLTGDAKWGAYHAAEVLCLPSHSENLGMVVAEALACRLPVLISDKVNIWQDIETDGAGFVAPDTVAGTLSSLQRWLDLSEADRQMMARYARSCFSRRFEIRRVAATLIKVIETHIGRSRAQAVQAGLLEEGKHTP